MMVGSNRILRLLCNRTQRMTMEVRFRYRIWRICTSPILFTLKESLKKTLTRNTKLKSFRAFSSKMLVRPPFSFRQQLTRNSQNVAVVTWTVRRHQLLKIIMTNNCMKSLGSKMILHHNRLKSQKCNITQWAATISARCCTAQTSPSTKLTKTKIRMKIKKATR